MESLADRLAYETRQPSSAAVRPADDNDGPPPNKLSNAALRESLTKIDELYEKSVWAYSGRRRTEALSLIHASQVTHFINSPGFGVGRGGGPAYWTLYQDQRQLPLPMPSGESATKPDASAEDFATRRDDPAQSPVPGEIAARLESLHGEAQVDFADPKGFGYVKDREHVVGFQSHHFRHPLFIPPAEKLGIRKVELVSLLKHEKPMVYLSKNLPQMDELKNAPVRPLDAFEEQSLPALRDGGNLETRADGNRIRMLGAIRAARQCLNCHAVEHGTLLGAFSYELTSEGTSPVRPAAVKPDPVKPAL
jgi:hypothetical protein